MADNIENTGRQDDTRVDFTDASEVEYLRSRHPRLSHEEIQEAVEQHGPMREDIEKQLRER